MALLLAVSLPNLSASLGAGAATVLMPLLQRDLGLSTVLVGWIGGGARFVGLIVLSVPIAAFVTRLGVRRAMLVAQVGFGLGVAALAAATTPAPALLAVASGGVCLAALNPATTTAVLARFPARLRAQAMNIKQAGVPLGHLLAALLFPPLAVAAGWRVALLLAAGVSGATSVVTHRLYTDDPGPGDGAAVTHRVPAATTLIMLLRHRPLLRLSAMQALTMGAQSTLLAYYAVSFVERGFGLAVVAANIAVMQLAGFVGRLVWGFAARYVFHARPRPALVAVVAVSALGVGALAIVPTAAGVGAMAAVAVLVGLGVMANAGMIEWVRSELLPPAAAAAATGVGYSIGGIGATLAPPLLGVVAERFGFPAAWAVSAATLVVAVGLALTLPETGTSRG
jgi:MFS family permease